MWGRNSIGVEVDPAYFEVAHSRMVDNVSLFGKITVEVTKKQQ